MPIDNIMRTFKSNEKEMLIDSMEKLIEFYYFFRNSLKFSLYIKAYL